jgi:hypothetical protein
MAMEAYERNSKLYKGKLTDDQIAFKTADQANAAFGGLNYRKLGRNKTFQDVLRLGALAPDFLEARIRFSGQALKPEQFEQTAAIMRLGLAMFITARIANTFIDGNPHWDRPFGIVVNGQEFSLRSVPGDIMHAATDPRSFLYHRLNPTLARTIVEGLTGRDMYGKERDLQSQVKDLLVTHIPIPLQGSFRKGDQKLWESVVSSFGLSTYKYKTDAEREMGKLIALNIPSKQLEKEEEVIVNAKAKMKESIRANKSIDPEVMKEINKLSPNQAKAIWLSANKYTKFEAGLNRLNIRETLKVYNKTLGFRGDEKEKQLASQELARKYIKAVKGDPSQISILSDSEKSDLQKAISGQ